MKIIGIGDNVVDKYLSLNTMFPGGNALNFSVYSKLLGIESAYIGIFGNDKAASHIIHILKKLKINISHCRFFEGANGYAEVDLVNGERIFVGSNGGGVCKNHSIFLDDSDLEYIKNFTLVHSSCFSRIEKELYKIKNLGVPISFDFSNRIEESYLKEVCSNITYGFLSCDHSTEEETKKKLEKVIKYGAKLALATRGTSRTILLYDNNFYYQEVSKVKAIDTLGAGDSFITSFLLNILKGKGAPNEEVVKKGLKKASEFAAKICLSYGAFGYGKKIH